MRAFRNAQPDSLTNCGGDYLTGQKGETANWIYWTGGFDVVFMKADGFGKALPGATFTLYTDEDCADNHMFEMSFQDGKRATTVSSDGNATYKDKNGNTVTLLKGEVLLSKVPPKTFYLKETSLPTTNPDGEPYAYKANETVYEVTISEKGILTMQEKRAGETAYTEVYKVVTTPVGTDPAEYQYRVMNISAAERKVILRKVDGSFNPAKATFEILRYDRSQVSADINGTPTVSFTSTASGVFFIGNLPYGTYYLHETAPFSKWFILTVNEKGYGYELADKSIISTLNAEPNKP